MIKLVLLCSILALFLGQAIQAGEIRLAGIFTDHAVLQRNIPVPVWGWAEPESEVTVTFAGQEHSTVADASGKWTVNLDPLAASATGRELTASSGGKTITMTDILVGEVWHAGGQSNMEGAPRMDILANDPRVAHSTERLINTPTIRFFKTTHDKAIELQEDFNPELIRANKGGPLHATWVPSSTDTLGKFSGTASYFAAKLSEKLNVPIGIIITARSATSIASFIDPALLNEEKPAPSTYSSRIHPMVRYGIAGMIWYQGEANRGENALQYLSELELLIGDLREKNDFPEMPFYLVQLCSHTDPRKEVPENIGWPIVQDQQRRGAGTIPHVGLAVANDIDGHHPSNKFDIGERLAFQALAKTYGLDIPHESPLYRSHTVDGSQVTVEFDGAESGFTFYETVKIENRMNVFGEVPDHKTDKFELAGSDYVWEVADEVTFVGNTVVLSSSKVPNPVHVRYAFKEYLRGPRLYNKDQLPMATFNSGPDESVIAEQQHYKDVVYPQIIEAKKASRVSKESEKK